LLSQDIFTDVLGRKNYLKAVDVLVGLTLAVNRRLIIAVPQTAFKYVELSSALAVGRSENRAKLLNLRELLDRLSTLDEYNGPEMWKLFQEISHDLFANVRARPYSLIAFKAIELLGAVSLPEKTIAGRVQRQLGKLRERRGIKSMRNMLKEGDYEGVREMLVKISKMITRVLEVHEDYKTVKLSPKSQKKANL
jgi:hypothetical protein